MDFVENAIFADRADAGRQLGQRLLRYADEAPIVLALPRGGVPVGFEIAQALKAPLDVIVARKLGAPDQPELGIGAVAPEGVVVLDDLAIDLLGISSDEIRAIAARETVELDRRLLIYRGNKPLPELAGRTVILVDDGLATGVTARAAIQSIRRRHPRRLVLAVPVCASETADIVAHEVDDLVCLIIPSYFQAVGLWYRDFEQLTDDEVLAILDRSRAEQPLL